MVEGFLDRPGRGLKRMYFCPAGSGSELMVLHAVLDLVAPPDLTQARVNKCLIALVNRKIVTKENSTVREHSSPHTLAFKCNVVCSGGRPPSLARC